MLLNRPTVYVETTVIGHVVGRIRKDLVSAARQAITREWWPEAGVRFDLRLSQLVVEKCPLPAMPEPRLSGWRCSRASHCFARRPKPTISRRRLIHLGAIPATEPRDALHVATAAVHRRRVSGDVELPAHRERGDDGADLRGVRRGRIPFPRDLHPRAAHGRTPLMPDDIVDEVRAVRHELAAVQRDDIGRIGRDLRQREADLRGGRLDLRFWPRCSGARGRSDGGRPKRGQPTEIPLNSRTVGPVRVRGRVREGVGPRRCQEHSISPTA